MNSFLKQVPLLWLSCLALLILSLSPRPVAGDTQATSEPVIVVLGDSLSAGYGFDIQLGWVHLLQQTLKREGIPGRIVNASISGNTSEDGLSRLPGVLARHNPDVVILELGGNDGLRGLPVALLRQNLEQLINLSQQAGAEVLLAGIRLPPNYGPRYVKAFEAVYAELARRFELEWLPFLLDGIALTPGLMQGDGVHPSADAQPRIVENVLPVVVRTLKSAQNKP